MRKVNRDTAARVPGLDDTVDREPSATNSVVVAAALQSRPATYLVRARSSRSTAGIARRRCNASGIVSIGPANCGALRLERTSSRVQSLASCCLTVVELWRTTMRRDALKSNGGEDPLARCVDCGATADPLEPLVRSAQPYVSGLHPERYAATSELGPRIFARRSGKAHTPDTNSASGTRYRVMRCQWLIRGWRRSNSIRSAI